MPNNGNKLDSDNIWTPEILGDRVLEACLGHWEFMPSDIRESFITELTEELADGHLVYVPPASPETLTAVVNQPTHYRQGHSECIDVIRNRLGPDGFKSFCLGNMLKYTYRAGFKETSSFTIDMAKAKWYERMADGDDPRKDTNK